MLTTELLTRSRGVTSATSTAQTLIHRQLLALQPAPRIRFDGQEPNNTSKGSRRLRDDDFGESVVSGGTRGEEACLAHKAGVNALAIDQFEGR